MRTVCMYVFYVVHTVRTCRCRCLYVARAYMQCNAMRCDAMRCTRLNAHARESIELAGKGYRAGSWDAGNLGTWEFGKVALGTYVPMYIIITTVA